MKTFSLVTWLCIIAFCALQLWFIGSSLPAFDSQVSKSQTASSYKTEYIKASVQSIINTEQAGDQVQIAKVILQEGVEKNKVVEISYSVGTKVVKSKPLAVNDSIMIIKGIPPSGEPNYSFAGRYRIDVLIVLAVIFACVVIAIAGLKGLGSLLSLVASISAIGFYTIPALIAKQNVLLVGLITAIIIATVSLFLSHGFAMRSRIAWVSIMITLLSCVSIAILSVNAASLTGLSEEVGKLSLGVFGGVSILGLTITAIIISAVGVLDDVATSQAAVVDELHKANPGLSVLELFTRSMSVGREHIASMVNSLVLVYLGASFGRFLIIFGSGEYPLAVALNLEQIATEIVSTLVVSIALTLAVPITSILAANVVKNPTRLRIQSLTKLLLTRR